jgi:hypothetical protein
VESRLLAFRFAISPLKGTAPNPVSMDGGNMTHSYDDNDRLLSQLNQVRTGHYVGGKYDINPIVEERVNP